MRKGRDSDIENEREGEKHTHKHPFKDLHFIPVEELPLHPLPSHVLFFSCQEIHLVNERKKISHSRV